MERKQPQSLQSSLFLNIIWFSCWVFSFKLINKCMGKMTTFSVVFESDGEMQKLCWAHILRPIPFGNLQMFFILHRWSLKFSRSTKYYKFLQHKFNTILEMLFQQKKYKAKTNEKKQEIFYMIKSFLFWK